MSFINIFTKVWINHYTIILCFIQAARRTNKEEKFLNKFLHNYTYTLLDSSTLSCMQSRTHTHIHAHTHTHTRIHIHNRFFTMYM